MKKLYILYIIILLFLSTESTNFSILFAQNSQNDQNQQSENVSENKEEQTQKQKNPGNQPKSDETNKIPEKELALSAPVITATKGNFTDKIEIKWTNIPEADKYFIHRSINNEEFTELAQTQSFVFTDSTADPGKIYYYKIKAWSEKRNFSEFSNADKGYLKLNSPHINVSDNFTDLIEIKWQKVPGAKKYYIFRANTKNGEYEEIGDTESTSFEDNSAESGKTYYYKATSWAEPIGYSEYSVIAHGVKKLKTPRISISDEKIGKITLTWDNIQGAEKYIIYRSELKDSEFMEIAAVKTTSYSASAKDAYSYKIRAFANNNHSDYSNTTSGEGVKTYKGLYLRGIIPGLGQFYRGNSKKGLLYGGGFAISALLLIGSIQLQNYTWNQYDSLEYGASSSEFDNKYNAYKIATYGVWLTAGLTVIVYVLNWVDLLYFNNSTGDKPKNSNIMNNTYTQFSFKIDINNTEKNEKTVNFGYYIRF